MTDILRDFIGEFPQTQATVEGLTWDDIKDLLKKDLDRTSATRLGNSLKRTGLTVIKAASMPDSELDGYRMITELGMMRFSTAVLKAISDSANSE